MIRRLLALCAPLLFACASAPATSAPLAVELETFTYDVVVPTVPEGVSQMVLTVPLPAPTPLRVLSIHGLVGNAPFDVPVKDGDDVSFSNEHVSLSLTWTSHSVHTSACLQLTTPGKPVELGLRLGLPVGFTGAAELEQSLLEHTTIAGDGRSVEAAHKRFARVR